MIRPETSYVLDEEVVTDAQQAVVGVFRGASSAKAICDDAICAWPIRDLWRIG
jgi:hypothetical protein